MNNETRNDGFLSSVLGGLRNKATGFNTGCDSATEFTVEKVHRFKRQTLDNIYRSSKIYQKIADLLPEDAGKKKWALVQGNGKVANRNIQRVQAKLEELKARDLFTKAGKWARLYGNTYIILGLVDGRTPDQELDINNVTDITFMMIRDNEDMTPHYGLNAYTIEYFEIALGNEELENIEVLFPNGEATNGVLRIHPSRVLEFKGIELPPKIKQDNTGFDDSVVQNVYQEVAMYAQAIGASSTMLVRSGMAIFKMANLIDYAETENTNALTKRFEFLNTGLSVFKSMFLDSSPDLNESIEYLNQNFGGSDKIIDKLMDHLVMISGYPRSILLGSSNSNAFSEGGESDRREWARCVSSYQYKYWRENANHLVQICLAALGIQTDDVHVMFPTIYEHTEGEIAELRVKQKDMAIAYVNTGILSKEEVRQSFFGTEELSNDITLIPGSLEAEQEAAREEERAKLEMQREVNPPTPPANNN